MLSTNAKFWVGMQTILTQLKQWHPIYTPFWIQHLLKIEIHKVWSCKHITQVPATTLFLFLSLQLSVKRHHAAKVKSYFVPHYISLAW